MKLRNKDILSKFANDQFINITTFIIITGIVIIVLCSNNFFEYTESLIIILICTLYLHIIGKEMSDSIEKFQKEYDERSK
jgi:hypothetical protein